MTDLKSLTSVALKILLVGPSGNGKTCLATTLGKRAVVLDLNRGLGSAMTLKDGLQEARGLCDVKNCWGGSPGDVWKRTASYVESYVQRPERPALVIDGLSDLLEASLGEALGDAGYAGGAKVTQPMWGVAIAQVERLMWKLRSTNTVVVMLAHTQRIMVDSLITPAGAFVKLEEDVTKEVLAVYGKALPQKIPAMFDEVWYLRTSGSSASQKRLVQSQPSDVVECCKTRYQLPDGTSASLGMEKLLDMIGWKWEPKTAPMTGQEVKK